MKQHRESVWTSSTKLQLAFRPLSYRSFWAPWRLSFLILHPFAGRGCTTSSCGFWITTGQSFTTSLLVIVFTISVAAYSFRQDICSRVGVTSFCSDEESMQDDTSVEVLKAAKETLLQGLSEENQGLQ